MLTIYFLFKAFSSLQEWLQPPGVAPASKIRPNLQGLVQAPRVGPRLPVAGQPLIDETDEYSTLSQPPEIK